MPWQDVFFNNITLLVLISTRGRDLDLIFLRSSVTRGNALPHADVGCTFKVVVT